MSTEILKPVGDALALRLKTPLVGTFILSWVLINHSFALEFLFTSLDSKVAMAKASQFDLCTDLIYPFGLTLLYLLAIPAVQLLLDNAVLKTLGEYRKRHDSRVARNAVESTQEHQIKLRDSKLDNWGEEKLDLNKEIDKLEKEMRELVSQLQQVEQNNTDLETNKKELKASISKAIESLEMPATNAGSEYADTRSEEEVYNETLKILRLAVLEGDIPF